MNEYRFRLATPVDADLIHTLTQDAFSEYKTAEMPSSALNETLIEVRDALEQSKMQAVLCLAEHEEVVGCVRFRFDDGLYFFRLAVARHWQGRGVAKALLKWLEQYAAEHGQRRLWCRVRAGVPRNIDLYLALGYQIIDREQVPRDGKTIETLHMAKKTLSV